MSRSDPARQPGLVYAFLQRTLPFSDLAPQVLHQLARQCTVEFMPSGTVVMRANATRPEALYIVQQGGVRLTTTGTDGTPALNDTRGEGGVIGAVALLEKTPATADVETIEDTFFVRIPRAAFLELTASEPTVGQFFLHSLPERFVSRAFSEMRVRCEGLADERGLYLFASKAGDLVNRPPESVIRGTSLRQAAGRMVEAGVGSLLVREVAGTTRDDSRSPLVVDEAMQQLRDTGCRTDTSLDDVIGIVTDSDLRKAVSLCMDYEAPVETIMTAPVASVDESRPCFDALLEMMRRQIHHLAVLRQRRICGVITAHDIMVMQGRTPLSLFREIMHQRSLEGLYPLGNRIAQVVRGLVEEGARAASATRMITVFNDLLLEKVLTLLRAEMGPPPLAFSWMLMGSEGRREQTFLTDQDNALVLADCEDDIIVRAAEVYFEPFAKRAVDELEKCGFNRCRGNVMASNPDLRRTVSSWRERLTGWIRRPEPEQILNTSIFFDFRSGYGDGSLINSLRDSVIEAAAADEIFLRHLAADALRGKPPLSFFRNLVVEKNGEHRNALDMKKRGMMPFVDFARVMALAHGIRETSTIDRLAALEESGHVPAMLCREARDGYEFLMHVRLVHQLEQLQREETPDNHVSPASLTDLDKRTMKEAFAVAERLQSFLKDRFRLDLS